MRKYNQRKLKSKVLCVTFRLVVAKKFNWVYIKRKGGGVGGGGEEMKTAQKILLALLTERYSLGKLRLKTETRVSLF